MSNDFQQGICIPNTICYATTVNDQRTLVMDPVSACRNHTVRFWGEETSLNNKKERRGNFTNLYKGHSTCQDLNVLLFLRKSFLKTSKNVYKAIEQNFAT